MQNQQYCEGRKIDQGWLTDEIEEYFTLLTKALRQQFKQEQQSIAQKELITIDMISNLCLGMEQKKEEIIIQKKSGVTGGFLDRTARFDKNILQQLKDHKPVKNFPPYSHVYIETKAPDQKTWYNKNGDMARLLLEFTKGHTPIYVYRKDKNQAIKWQRYLVIEKLVQESPKLVARCFEHCYQEYEDKFTFTWALKLSVQLGQYTQLMNQQKKQHAKLEKDFLVQTDRQVMTYHIKRWQQKSLKLYKDEQDQLERMKQLSLREQELLKATEKQREEERVQREKRRLEMLESMINIFRPKKQEIQRYYRYWQDRAIHIHNNNPKKFTIKIIRMYIQSNVQLIRPQLELKFISDRTENTKDIENQKTLDGLQYNIEQGSYFICRLLAQMSQQRRRDYTCWNFKDGLLGLCGSTKMNIENMGYKDYIDMQVIDTIKTNTSSKVLRIQLQDLIQYLYEGRSFWVQLEFGASKIFVEMDILDKSNIDPIFLDRLKYIQLNSVLRKVSVKMIEQRTPVPIVETVKYSLEIERYSEEIQQLYQELYIENICLQPQCQPTQWFQSLEGMEKVVKPVVEILKRNYLEFTEISDNVQIYYQLKQIPDLRLPLLKDVDDFMNKLPVIQQKWHTICKGMLTSFLIYCNIRTIQLNVSILQTLFHIASKFICITHSHFFYKLSNPVFGNKFDPEAQAFWLFTTFVELMRNLHYPLQKVDSLFNPQEVVMQYMEVLHKDKVKHCKNYDIAIENIFYDILASFYTTLVQSLPLCNIWNLIIRKITTNHYVYQLVLIVFIEELGEKLLFTQNSEDFKNAIAIQAQLMDILQLEGSYTQCESNLNRIINAEESIHESKEHSNINQQLIQDC